MEAYVSVPIAFLSIIGILILITNVKKNDEENNKICVEIHSVLDDTLIANGSDPEEESQKVELTQDILKNCLNEVGLPKNMMDLILKSREELLPLDTLVSEVVDKKAVAEANKINYIADLKELLKAAAIKLAETYSDDDALVKEIREKI